MQDGFYITAKQIRQFIDASDGHNNKCTEWNRLLIMDIKNYLKKWVTVMHISMTGLSKRPHACFRFRRGLVIKGFQNLTQDA